MPTEIALFAELVNDPLARIESGALGAVTGEAFTSAADIRKPVKIVAGSSFAICVAAGDEIDGFIATVSSTGPVNGGFAFGSVQRDRRIEAQVATDQVSNIALLGLVVSGAGNAVAGTANTLNLPQVKGGAPTSSKWRVIRHITGTGVAGDRVLLEKV